MKLRIVDIQPDQTLWGIAEEHLGSGQLWRDVLVMNAVVLAENIGDELAKTLHILGAGTQLVVPADDDDDGDFQPSGM